MTMDANDIARAEGVEGLRKVWDATEPAKAGEARRPKLRIINPADWTGAPIPTREWIVPDLIPARTVTLLSADGGTGKSVLALQLAVARALHKGWLSTKPAPGRTLYLSAEDDADELHRRLEAIRFYYEAEWSDLTDIRLVDLVGKSAVLGEVTKGGLIQATELYRAVEQQVRAFRPSLVVIDALADAFAGEENHRAQARQFISLLRHLGQRYGCAALPLAHPSLSGMSSGTGMSGSTAWSNSVRSRLYLEAAKASDDSVPDPDLRTLTVRKANYAKSGTVLTMRWQDGVYVPEDGLGSLDRMAQANRAASVFLELLAAYEAEGRHVSPTPSATYAPKVFAADQRSGGIGKRFLADAMNRLFAEGRIRTGQHGRPSDPRTHIELAEPGPAE